MKIASIFGHKEPDTQKAEETTAKRSLTTLEKYEASLPIYQQYIRQKRELETSLQHMRFTITDDPHFAMRKNQFLTDAQYEAAKKKHNDQRAASHREAIERTEKKLQDLKTEVEANLLIFWL